MVQEWVHGLSVIQSEEVRRVGEFAYQRDAKYALVGISDTALVSMHQWSTVVIIMCKTLGGSLIDLGGVE